MDTIEVIMIIAYTIEDFQMVLLCTYCSIWITCLLPLKSMAEIDKLKACLNGEFEMKDLRITNNNLRMEIHIHPLEDKLFLS